MSVTELPQAATTAGLYTEIQQFYAQQMHLLDDGRVEEWAHTFTTDGVFAANAQPVPAVGREAITAAAAAATEAYAKAGCPAPPLAGHGLGRGRRRRRRERPLLRTGHRDAARRPPRDQGEHAVCGPGGPRRWYVADRGPPDHPGRPDLTARPRPPRQCPHAIPRRAGTLACAGVGSLSAAGRGWLLAQFLVPLTPLSGAGCGWFAGAAGTSESRNVAPVRAHVKG